MGYRLEFEIEGLPKTINEIGRKHWAIKAREARFWKTNISIITSGKRPKNCIRKAKLELTRYSTRSPDADGLVSSFKHVIDGLVESQIICDDSYSIIGMPEYKWEKAPKDKGKIKVIIEEIETGNIFDEK